MTIKASRLGCRFYEVPIDYHGVAMMRGRRSLGRTAWRRWAASSAFGSAPRESQRRGLGVLEQLNTSTVTTPRSPPCWSPGWVRPSWRRAAARETLSFPRRAGPPDGHDLDPRSIRSLELTEDYDEVEVMSWDMRSREPRRRPDTIVCLNVLEHIALREP